MTAQQPPPHVRQVGSREIYRNAWMTVREDDVEYSDGSRSIYGLIEKRDFAVVVAEQDGVFHLVDQFRYPVGRRSVEFPMGGWPAERTGSALELAQLELQEETGFTAASWRHLGRLALAVGHSNQSFDVFHATGLTPGPHHREATESDMVHLTMTEPQLRAQIAGGELFDTPTVAAYQLFELHRERP